MYTMLSQYSDCSLIIITPAQTHTQNPRQTKFHLYISKLYTPMEDATQMVYWLLKKMRVYGNELTEKVEIKR